MQEQNAIKSTITNEGYHSTKQSINFTRKLAILLFVLAALANFWNTFVNF